MRSADGMWARPRQHGSARGPGWGCMEDTARIRAPSIDATASAYHSPAMPTDVRPLDTADLDAAAALLADRHRRHRLVEPILDPAYEDASAARAEIEKLLAGELGSGWVARRDDEVVGFIVGIGKDAKLWGPNVWIEPAGHAADRPRRGPRPVCRGRGVVGRRRAERTTTSSSRPRMTSLVDAWFSLDFGPAAHPRASREPAGVVRRHAALGAGDPTADPGRHPGPRRAGARAAAAQPAVAAVLRGPDPARRGDPRGDRSGLRRPRLHVVRRGARGQGRRPGGRLRAHEVVDERRADAARRARASSATRRSSRRRAGSGAGGRSARPTSRGHATRGSPRPSRTGARPTSRPTGPGGSIGFRPAFRRMHRLIA